MDRLIIFDGDDTLWETEPLYDAARSEVAALVARHGVHPQRWEALEREIDVANVARFGLTAKRFPTSCVEALEVLWPDAPDVLRDEARKVAATVFDAHAPLLPGAAETVQLLRDSGVTLVLLTRGDQEVQERRVQSSGLEASFAHVEVVPEKTSDVFSRLVERFGRSEQAISVGNSLASDICPAVEVGLSGVWIDAHVWEYERGRSQRDVPDGVFVLRSLWDLYSVLREPGDAPARPR